jgi:hypothetical protein
VFHLASRMVQPPIMLEEHTLRLEVALHPAFQCVEMLSDKRVISFLLGIGWCTGP